MQDKESLPIVGVFILGVLIWVVNALIIQHIIWPVGHQVFPVLSTIAIKTISFGQALALSLVPTLFISGGNK